MIWSVVIYFHAVHFVWSISKFIHHFSSQVLSAVRAHNVVVIAGETGSGKSTQIPQFILEVREAVHGPKSELSLNTDLPLILILSVYSDFFFVYLWQNSDIFSQNWQHKDFVRGPGMDIFIFPLLLQIFFFKIQILLISYTDFMLDHNAKFVDSYL